MFETIVVILIAAAIVTMFIKRRGRSGGAPAAKGNYIRLLKAAGGDDELAERLVDAERKRNPFAPNERLAELALKRWEKDRRN